ncbi:MAG: DUF1579 family protein [Planctomycetes bacterium]|nr:DUF1579 family protein [Planctomycetota bacterium]
MRSRGPIALLVPAFCAGLVAAEASAQDGRADLGAPAEEHRKLDAMAGDWDVSLQFPVGPGKTGEGKASCEARWMLDGRFLRLEYASTFMGRPLTVLRYVGFDRHAGKFVETHFESAHTDVLWGTGSLSEDGKTLTCTGTHVDAKAGAPAKVRTVTTFQGPEAFRLEMTYLDAEGKDSKTIVLAHARKKERAEAPALYRVVLQVSDLGKAAEFYSTLLDVEGRKIRGGRHYFDCGPVILALLDTAEGGAQARPAPENVYFSVKDLEKVRERAAALGCLSKESVDGAPAGEIVKRPWGERSFYAVDPFGNKLCFVDGGTLFTGR